MYVDRAAAATLDRLSSGFPVVQVTGPRQSGKTTLARHARSDLPSVSLEQPDERTFALDDPVGFLARFPDGLILDEVQRVPDLLSWLQGMSDADGRMGRFVLTGSQQPELSAAVAQSLAGRVGRLELLPLSGAELRHAGLLADDLDHVLWSGGYPAIYDRPVSAHDWLANYTSTYIERDVRQLLEVRDRNTFTRFVRAVAARSAQLLNMTSLGGDVGVSGVTARSWLSVMEATYVILMLEPYAVNVSTRVTKSPKVAMLDSGLTSHLLGIREPAQLATHPLRGQIFETWGISEVAKALANRGERTELAFLRDERGLEVDLVVRIDGRLAPIEFKSGMTYVSEWGRPARRWIDRLPGEAWADPVVVYGGDESFMRSGVHVRSWRDFAGDPLALLNP